MLVIWFLSISSIPIVHKKMKPIKIAKYTRVKQQPKKVLYFVWPLGRRS